MAFAPVIALLGRLISLFAVAMLAPAVCGLIYGEFRAAGIFAGSAAVTVFFGVGMIFAMRIVAVNIANSARAARESLTQQREGANPCPSKPVVHS